MEETAMKRGSMALVLKRGVLALVLALGVGLHGCASTYGEAQAPNGDEPAYDAPPPPGDVDPDVSTFYDALAPYGNWFQDDTYGWAWYPLDVPVDWRPYTNGQWIWTDEGWTWASDFDWGWAPFHYGRWFDHPQYGWCWLPGGDWAPAWVAWREGDDWVGWAPLPPEAEWNAGVGFGSTDWDQLAGSRYYGWSFCREGDLPGVHVQRRLAPLPKSVVLVRETRNVTDYRFVGSRVVNRSLDVAPVRAAYGHDIRTYRVSDSPRPLMKPGSRIERDTFYAYRPRLAPAPRDRTPRIAQGQPRPEAPTGTPPARGSAVGGGRYGAARESEALPKRQAAEKKRLEADQQREMKQPPRGVDQDQLRRQHEEEQRALDEQTAREQRVLQGRRLQEQQRNQGQPARQQPRAKGERKAPVPKGSGKPDQAKQKQGKQDDGKRPDAQSDRQK